MKDILEAASVLGAAVLLFMLLGWGLGALRRAEVDGCKYTGEASPVGTKHGVQTSYHYRCEGVDVFSSVKPQGAP